MTIDLGKREFHLRPKGFWEYVGCYADLRAPRKDPVYVL